MRDEVFGDAKQIYLPALINKKSFLEVIGPKLKRRKKIQARKMLNKINKAINEIEGEVK